MPLCVDAARILLHIKKITDGTLCSWINLASCYRKLYHHKNYNYWNFCPSIYDNLLVPSNFFFFFLTSISQILFSKYLVAFLLQSPSSSEVSLWNSVLNIQGNTQNYNYIYNYFILIHCIFYCISYDHSLFNIWLNNEFIPSNLFSSFQLQYAI